MESAKTGREPKVEPPAEDEGQSLSPPTLESSQEDVNAKSSEESPGNNDNDQNQLSTNLRPDAVAAAMSIEQGHIRHHSEPESATTKASDDDATFQIGNGNGRSDSAKEISSDETKSPITSGIKFIPLDGSKNAATSSEFSRSLQYNSAHKEQRPIYCVEQSNLTSKGQVASNLRRSVVSSSTSAPTAREEAQLRRSQRKQEQKEKDPAAEEAATIPLADDVNSEERGHGRARLSILGGYARDEGEEVRISRISVGPQFQANVSPYPPSEENDDRDECVWRGTEFALEQPLDATEFEDFWNVARQHSGLSMNKALELLSASNFALSSALANLEKFTQRRRTVQFQWSESASDEFIAKFNKYGKNFEKIAKNISGGWSIPQLVEHYYTLKSQRCLTANSAHFVRCPFIQILGQQNGADIVGRGDCANCVGKLWKNSTTLGTQKSRLCLPCDLYFRRTQRHRPCALDLENDGEGGESKRAPEGGPSTSAQTTGNDGRGGGPHQHNEQRCLLARADRRRRSGGWAESNEQWRGEVWSEEQKCACIRGFRNEGKNFEAIAERWLHAEKSAKAIADFFTEFRFVYRLDYLVSLHDKEPEQRSGNNNQQQKNVPALRKRGGGDAQGNDKKKKKKFSESDERVRISSTAIIGGLWSPRRTRGQKQQPKNPPKKQP